MIELHAQYRDLTVDECLTSDMLCLLRSADTANSQALMVRLLAAHVSVSHVSCCGSSSLVATVTVVASMKGFRAGMIMCRLPRCGAPNEGQDWGSMMLQSSPKP